MQDIIVMAAQWQEDSHVLVRLRTQVFVEEQRVPASLETDDRDPDCLHVKALINGVIIGTGRLLADGYIGRMCVLEKFRSQGIGSLMLKYLVQQATDCGHKLVTLNSQSSAIPFYRKFGFIIKSDEFIEAGIPHQRMELNLNS